MSSSAFGLLVGYAILIIFSMKLLSTLGWIQWSQSRCQPLNPNILNMSQLKHILDQRGIVFDATVTESALTELVMNSGGLMRFELEIVSYGNNISTVNQFEKEYVNRDEMSRSVLSEPPTVWLVLSGPKLKRPALESRNWIRFLQQLSKHGIRIAFLLCVSESDCDSSRVMLFHRKGLNPHDRHSSVSYHYHGPLSPRRIFPWIFKTLSQNLFTTQTVSEAINYWEANRRTVPVVAASCLRPSPLSYEVLAAEFSGRVSFLWTDELDLNIPVLLVMTRSELMVFDSSMFLSQAEMRLLLNLVTLVTGDFIVLFGVFLVISGVLVPFLADSGQRLKSLFWYCLKCVSAGIFFVLAEAYYPSEVFLLLDILSESFSTLIEFFKLDILLSFHLFSEHPPLALTFPVYVLIFIPKLKQYLAKIFRAFSSSIGASINSKPIPDIDVKEGRINSTRNSLPLSSQKNPAGAEKPSAGAVKRNCSSVATMSTSTSNGSYNSDETSLKQALKHSSVREDSSDTFFTVTKRQVTPSGNPFIFPSLEASNDDFFDKATAVQFSKLSIPKYWCLPIISEKYLHCLRQTIRNKQVLYADAPGGTPGDVCQFCDAAFQSNSKICVLPCGHAFHCPCFDEWVKLLDIDCPSCHRPMYDSHEELGH